MYKDIYGTLFFCLRLNKAGIWPCASLCTGGGGGTLVRSPCAQPLVRSLLSTLRGGPRELGREGREERKEMRRQRRLKLLVSSCASLCQLVFSCASLCHFVFSCASLCGQPAPCASLCVLHSVVPWASGAPRAVFALCAPLCARVGFWARPFGVDSAAGEGAERPLVFSCVSLCFLVLYCASLCFLMPPCASLCFIVFPCAFLHSQWKP